MLKMINSFSLNYNRFQKFADLSQDFVVTFVVAVLHFLILAFLLLKSHSEVNQPTLSFSVTMMDVASTSTKVVSNQASVTSHSSAKKSEKVALDDSPIQSLKKDSKEELEDNEKTKSADHKSVNSIQQTAVLSPTKAAVYDAAYLSNSAPEYPDISRRLGEQGLVVLNVFVNIDGKAEKIEIKNSSGYSRLDMAALETVKNWRFIAAKDHDQVVSSWVQVPINFVLEKNHG